MGSAGELVVWFFVGCLLISYGISWFQETLTQFFWLFVIISLIVALTIFKFGFSKLAKQNLYRLQQKRKKICIFALMEWKSYGIMVFMMGLGYTMRTLIGPNPYLGLLYNGIGGAMFLAAFIYFKPLILLLKKDPNQGKDPFMEKESEIGTK